MQYFGVRSMTAFLFLAPLKILLAVNCCYSNGTVQVFATAQSFVMQLKDKYVFIFPTIQLYFCQRVVKVKRKIFVGKWVKNNEKCNRYRWYCSSQRFGSLKILLKQVVWPLKRQLSEWQFHRLRLTAFATPEMWFLSLLL